MSSLSADRARLVILSECAPALLAYGHTPEALPDDFDLRANGIIDSLGFLEVVVALERVLGFELDFEDLDPDDLTVVGPLSRYVAEQSHARAAASNGVALAREAS